MGDKEKEYFDDFEEDIEIEEEKDGYLDEFDNDIEDEEEDVDDYLDLYSENEEEPDDDYDDDITSILLKRTTNNDQADADDIAEDDALEGAYDEPKLIDELDTVMDAEEDLEADADIEDIENTYAKMILEQCQGVDEDNKPKATIAISLSMENPETEKIRTIAEAAFCSAPLEINGRHRFVEIVLTYKATGNHEMKVLWSHLQKYGELLNEQDNMNAEEMPSFKMYVVPHSALGTSFISAVEPVSWALCSSNPETLPDQLRILFDADDVDFFETDEIDLEEIDAEAQRMIDQNAELYANAEEIEREKAEQAARNNATIDKLRKGGFFK